MNNLIFHELTKSAEKFGSKRALVCGDHSFTYAEFEAFTNQICNFLFELKAQKGDRVGISLEKSDDYVCLQFGTLKAGGCYVPIDHSFPTTRIFQIIDDCGIKVLFGSRSILDQILVEPEIPACLEHFVLVDGDPTDLPQIKAFALHTEAEMRKAPSKYHAKNQVIDTDLAYIMYTSGSTGKPKGVMVSHRNILTFMEWCNIELGITADDRIINTAPFTFDISGLDTFNSISKGATLYVIKDQRMINTVLACIDREKITFCSTVPTVIGTIVNRPQIFKKYDLTSIKTFISGAAACPAIFMKKLGEFLPNTRLMNIYGPTEATIYCMYHWIDAKTLDVDKVVPIGIPFENTESYVINAEGKEVAPGETGELILRGTQIACGYYNNAEKTQAAFKNFPLQPHLNERVYFTGDIARKDPDGLFYFLGRKDDMIKSRGYRIELNEIEIAMSSLDSHIQEHAAVAVPDPLIENMIYAAVVLKEGVALSEDEIRAHCKNKIPDYMIPEKFIFVSELPKTTSGKISRKDIVKRIQDEKL